MVGDPDLVGKAVIALGTATLCPDEIRNPGAVYVDTLKQLRASAANDDDTPFEGGPSPAGEGASDDDIPF